MANEPRFIGLTDEVLTCDCCGKSNLKSTVMISLDGESDPVYYGSDCAARTLAGRGVKMTGRQIVRAAEDAQRRAAELIRVQAEIARGALLTDCLATSRAHLARLTGGMQPSLFSE